MLSKNALTTEGAHRVILFTDVQSAHPCGPIRPKRSYPPTENRELRRHAIAICVAKRRQTTQV